MYSFFSKTVLVSFVDCATGRQFAASKMPPDQLPDTFAIDTELEIEGAHYVVLRAEPETKAGFARTKQLTLTLRKIETVDPKKILFSLPTICDAALPKSAMVAVSGDVHVMHEDDWRQCEFVSAVQHAEISAELASVRRIHAEAVAGGGWREIHLRQRIKLPLPRGLKWSEITALLGEFETMGGIAFSDPTKPVVDAVAVRLAEGVILWGVEEAGALAVLCVENVTGGSTATIAGLKRIAASLSLVLVHWCRCQVYATGSVPIEHSVGAPWDSAASRESQEELGL